MNSVPRSAPAEADKTDVRVLGGLQFGAEACAGIAAAEHGLPGVESLTASRSRARRRRSTWRRSMIRSHFASPRERIFASYSGH